MATIGKGAFAAMACAFATAACFSDVGGSEGGGATTGGSSSGEPSTGTASDGTTTGSASTDVPASSSGDASSTDAPTTGTSTGDDGSSTGAPGRCDPEAAFGEAVELVELDTDENQDRAWLSDDELTVYVSGNYESGYDIYTAGRDALDDAFGTLEPLLAVPANEERGPALTADGLTLFVASSDVGTQLYDIVFATRRGLLSPFGSLAPVANVNDAAASDRTPWIDAEGTTLWFSSNRSGNYDLYRSESNGAVFGAPEPVGELNGAANEEAPVLSADGLAIFFASDRDGGLGSSDVWMATRVSAKDGFGPAQNVAEPSSPAYDWPTWLSLDGCRLYLASRRNAGGDFDLFVAARR